MIAGGAVRKILELAGVKDVLSKSHGSRNKLNVACATFNALQSLEGGKNPGKKITKEDLAIEETEEKKSSDTKKPETLKAPAQKPATKKPAVPVSTKTTDKKKSSDPDKK